MEISNSKNSTTLVIKFAKGQNLDGTPKIQSEKFTMISKTAEDETLFNVGKAIGNLLVSEPIDIKKVEDFSLVEAQ